MTIEERIAAMSLEEKAAYLTGKDFWKTRENKALDLPSFMMCDGPNGLRKQEGEADHLGINQSIETVCYPTASAVASSFDTELAEKLGERLGDECRKEHVSMLLGPGLNIKRSPLGGRNFEYYSEDPYLSGKMAAGYIKGLQSKNISACPKHFAANNQETQRMSGNSIVDERTLHEIYLTGFEMAVKEAHPKSMMCAYNQVNGTFMSENKELLTGVLRDKWGFDGFVVTDWGAGKDPVKGIEAGLDLVMPGGSEGNTKKIVEAVHAGILSEEKVDAAVRRIMTTMFWSRDGQPEQNSVLNESDTGEDYQFAKVMAENSAVLLKNEDKILPLGDERVAFIGAFADKPRYQGSGSSHINSKKVVSALSAAEGRNIIYAQGYDLKNELLDESLCSKAVEAAKNVDKVVVFAGLPDSCESEGFDRNTMEIPENQTRLIQEIAAVNSNMVVVLHNGSAVTMPWIGDVKAVLEMHLAGDAVGEAATSLLYGDVNPSGKLAETFPLNLKHNPSYLNFAGDDGCPVYHEGVFVGYRYYDAKEIDVLFPFGHGLSYTSFEYSNMKVDKTSLTDQEKVVVSVDVKNTGKRAGKEVVQLYVSPQSSSAARPVKELKGFVKIELKPKEKKTVYFTLSKRAFAYYEVRIHDFYVESGTYTLMIGSSSADIRDSVDVTVAGTVEIPHVFDENSTIGQILKTKKGQAVLGTMMQPMISQENRASDMEALGEGAARMQQAMMLEMPLAALVNLAGIPEEMIQNILMALNA